MRLEAGLDFSTHGMHNHLFRTLNKLTVLYHELLKNRAFRYFIFAAPWIRQ